MDSIRDALLKTQKGHSLVIEAKNRSVEIRDRVRYLKNLVHSTFVSNVPPGFRKRFDVYLMAKPQIRKLAKRGGESYNAAVEAVRWAWTSRRAYREAIEAISDPVELEIIRRQKEKVLA